MKNRHVYYVSIGLIVVALVTFFYKWKYEGLPLAPGSVADAWQVELRVQFEADGPVSLRTYLPRSAAGKNIIFPQIIHDNYGETVSTGENLGNDIYTLSKRDAQGTQVIYVRYTAQLYDTLAEPVIGKPSPKYPLFEGAQDVAVKSLLKNAEQNSSSENTKVSWLLAQISHLAPNDNVKVLLNNNRSLDHRSKIASKLVNAAGLPARRVSGVDLLQPSMELKLLHWLEVFIDGKWEKFNVENGQNQIGDNYVAWWRGNQSLVKAIGAKDLKYKISLQRIDQNELSVIFNQGIKDSTTIVPFSLFGLPIATQQVYRVLVSVPLGIFILLLLRNVVGVKSLGTFMPVLIAMSFRDTELLWGITLFVVIVSTGLLFRAYLEHLKLLLVPRLAAVLIFVILFMGMLSVATNKLGFDQGISVALFPMVIMTMAIERISILWDEQGATNAIKQSLMSLLIAVLCYLVMSLEIVEHLFFTFSELMLVLLALSMLLGRYTGYRLLELQRFAALTKKG